MPSAVAVGKMELKGKDLLVTLISLLRCFAVVVFVFCLFVCFVFVFVSFCGFIFSFICVVFTVQLDLICCR